MTAARSILIVEDEPLIAMMLEDFLDSLGHRVHGTCDSVECALDETEKGGFDLAILDVNLKGENVWPVATRLREKNVPFVIATGGHVDPPPYEPDAGRTLILGFGGNAWNGQDVAEYLHELYPDHNVAAFHYRGYPPSTGSPSAEALIADAPLVYDAAVGTAKPARVIVVGF